MSLRIVYFGTPENAASILASLFASQHEVVAAVTAPDRPAGRGLATKPSPVKVVAAAEGIDVIQPETLKDDATTGRLLAFAADVFVVVAYGLILPPAVLKTPRLAALNVHFSLLPRLRGAAPVQWALINGDPVTGVTVMQMDEGMDTGPILLRAEEEVDTADTAGTLMSRLTEKGSKVLLEALDKLEKGAIQAVPQDDALATYAPKLSTDDARVDWTMAAREIERRIRAFDPNPGAWTEAGGKRLKIWRAEVIEEEGSPPGHLQVSGSELLVRTGSASLRLLEVQPEGSSRMTASEYLRGRPKLQGVSD